MYCLFTVFDVVAILVTMAILGGIVYTYAKQWDKNDEDDKEGW